MQQQLIHATKNDVLDALHAAYALPANLGLVSRSVRPEAEAKARV